MVNNHDTRNCVEVNCIKMIGHRHKIRENYLAASNREGIKVILYINEPYHVCSDPRQITQRSACAAKVLEKNKRAILYVSQ